MEKKEINFSNTNQCTRTTPFSCPVDINLYASSKWLKRSSQGISVTVKQKKIITMFYQKIS